MDESRDRILGALAFSLVYFDFSALLVNDRVLFYLAIGYVREKWE